MNSYNSKIDISVSRKPRGYVPLPIEVNPPHPPMKVAGIDIFPFIRAMLGTFSNKRKSMAVSKVRFTHL